MSLFTGFFSAVLTLVSPATFAYVVPGSPTSSLDKPLVILDPGHGGDDPGAHIQGVIEKDLCLAIAKRLKADLERRGVPTRLSRESDVSLPLDQRVAESGQWQHAIFISLHMNQMWHQAKPHGIIVYSYGREEIAEKKPGLKLPPLAPPSSELARQSARLGDRIARQFRKRGFKARGVVKTDYYVLKNPNHPSVLVELGFLTNPSERRRLAQTGYQNKLSETLSNGIESFLRDREVATMTAALDASGSRR